MVLFEIQPLRVAKTSWGRRRQQNRLERQLELVKEADRMERELVRQLSELESEEAIQVALEDLKRQYRKLISVMPLLPRAILTTYHLGGKRLHPWDRDPFLFFPTGASQNVLQTIGPAAALYLSHKRPDGMVYHALAIQGRQPPQMSRSQGKLSEQALMQSTYFDIPEDEVVKWMRRIASDEHQGLSGILR